ncbi:MAG: hypothetical protein OEW67_08930 [Cyclobacteriaceae bacterium]|nr:hypothetical protein [Cyclobacteriaceae bacterium]
MNKTIEKLFFVILALAFTPFAFTLMPLIVLLGISAGLYMLIVAWKQQHHFE